MAVSRLGSDLISLLRNQGIEYSQDLILSLSSTVSEMVGNAQEHGESDCLIDIDITHNFSHNKREGKFGGFNVSILNFSNTYFGDKVKEKVVNNKIDKTIPICIVTNKAFSKLIDKLSIFTKVLTKYLYESTPIPIA